MAQLLLCAPGADAAQTDCDGRTPLHAAPFPPGLQQALQEAGAGPTAVPDSNGEGYRTAVAQHPAPRVTATPDRLAVAQLLLPRLAGGQVDHATATERATPLMHAAAAGSAARVQWLCSARLDLVPPPLLQQLVVMLFAGKQASRLVCGGEERGRAVQCRAMGRAGELVLTEGRNGCVGGERSHLGTSTLHWTVKEAAGTCRPTG